MTESNRPSVHPMEILPVKQHQGAIDMSDSTLDPRVLLQRIELLEKRCENAERCMNELASAVHQSSINQKNTYEALKVVIAKIVVEDTSSVVEGKVIYHA